jgi:hypothetical protein
VNIKKGIVTAASVALRARYKLTTKSLVFLINISLMRKFAHLRFFGGGLKHVYDNLQLINNFKWFLALVLKIMFANFTLDGGKGSVQLKIIQSEKLKVLRGLELSFVIAMLMTKLRLKIS